MPDTETETIPRPDIVYDPHAIFNMDGPIDPTFMADAIQALLRAYPLDVPETEAAQQRHLKSALVALAATNPRDPIEVMLGVQAISAYQAACVCWRSAMNGPDSGRDRTRQITTAATAARTFDTLLRALERRQAKPLSVPIGRPASRIWSNDSSWDPLEEVADRIRISDAAPVRERPQPPPAPVDPAFTWSPRDLAVAERMMESERVEKENAGLDIANTEGILPGGGMIMMEHPTPQQEAYMGRRLGLMYKREYEASLRDGIRKIPKIRGIRPGDLIP